MADIDDIIARSRPGPAFSNSTEYEMWEVNWCGRCLRDAPFRRMNKGYGCPIHDRVRRGEPSEERSRWLTTL
jgi:hypothetical protein